MSQQGQNGVSMGHSRVPCMPNEFCVQGPKWLLPNMAGYPRRRLLANGHNSGNQGYLFGDVRALNREETLKKMNKNDIKISEFWEFSLRDYFLPLGQSQKY